MRGQVQNAERGSHLAAPRGVPVGVGADSVRTVPSRGQLENTRSEFFYTRAIVEPHA